jgi:hypothetical protein
MRRLARIVVALALAGAAASLPLHAGTPGGGVPPAPGSIEPAAPTSLARAREPAAGCTAVAPGAPAVARTEEPVTGERRVVVALVNFADAPNEPFTRQQVDALFFAATDSLAAAIDENSFGELRLAGEVYGWLTFANRLPRRSDEIDQVVTRLDPEVTWREIDHLFVIVEGADYTGQASIGPGHVTTPDGGAIMSWAFVSDRGAELSLLLHEFGHNLGLRHASSWDCAPHPVGVDAKSPTTGCALVRYGDGYDPMSAGTVRHYSAYHKRVAGIMPAGQSLAVTEGRYTLDALATPSAGVKELRVPIDADRFYTIEFRLPVGFDATAGEPTDADPITGLLVRVGLADATQSDYDTLRPRLLVPNALPPEDSVEVLAGAPFSDPYRGLTVRLLSVAGDQAEVEIARGVPTPIVTIKADPPLLSQSGKTRLTWWTPDATACAASGGWDGPRNAGSGSEVVDVVETTTFVLTCETEESSTTEGVTVAVTGDLIVESLRMTPTRPRAGKGLTFLVGVLNQGRGAAGETSARLRIDAGGDGSWDVVSSQPLPPLGPFAQSRHRFRLAWPHPGSHRYEMCLDPEAVVPDAPRENNCLSGTFSAPAIPDPGAGTGLPDLYVASIRTRPPAHAVGNDVDWLVIAGNQGAADAADVRLDATLDAGSDGGVDVTATLALRAIPAGRTRGARVRDAWVAAAGTHGLRVCLDPEDRIAEADEGNNCGDLEFTVRGPCGALPCPP